jgi:predicted Mrr-cat superfamily restriction endonuclease
MNNVYAIEASTTDSLGFTTNSIVVVVAKTKNRAQEHVLKVLGIVSNISIWLMDVSYRPLKRTEGTAKILYNRSFITRTE